MEKTSLVSSWRDCHLALTSPCYENWRERRCPLKSSCSNWVAGNKAKSQLSDAQPHPVSCTLVASPGVVLLPWCFAVPEGFPDHHSHKLSCSITDSLRVINMTDWALKRLCNGDHKAQETRTCFPGIIGENSVMCRRQLRRQGALENPDDFWIPQILLFTVSESSKPLELGEFFTKFPLFPDHSFHLNTCWVKCGWYAW